MTTIESLTLDQIRTLQTEAGQFGDTATVEDCDLVGENYDTIFGDTGPTDEQWAAVERIVAVIRNNEAQSAKADDERVWP